MKTEEIFESLLFILFIERNIRFLMDVNIMSKVMHPSFVSNNYKTIPIWYVN